MYLTYHVEILKLLTIDTVQLVIIDPVAVDIQTKAIKIRNFLTRHKNHLKGVRNKPTGMNATKIETVKRGTCEKSG